MNHREIDKVKLDIHTSVVIIQLIPEDENEKQLLRKINSFEANDTERAIIDDYLNFNLNYSVVGSVGQEGDIYKLKVTIR